MVAIAGGRFTMGSTSAQKSWAAAHGADAKALADEGPQHAVSIRPFALGEYDITRAQYAAFVTETGYQSKGACSWSNPGFPQGDLDPVVCVSWQDAQAYVDWLNKRASESIGTNLYRLPTEAEWEYAARGGTTTLFWWGDDSKTAAEHAWFEANSAGHTQPIGTKPANGFGVFDTVGQAWQWTQDCYSPTYASAPANGSAVEGSSSCLRVARGGCWRCPLWQLRSTTRGRNPADVRDEVTGFRIARDL